MKSVTAVLLIIGATVAVARAAPAPTKLQDSDEEDIARFLNPRRIVRPTTLTQLVQQSNLARFFKRLPQLPPKVPPVYIPDDALMQDSDEDDLAKMALSFNRARQLVLHGLISPTNGQKLAQLQNDVLTQDSDEDDLAKMAGFFSIAKRVVGGLNHAINGEILADAQNSSYGSSGRGTRSC